MASPCATLGQHPSALHAFAHITRLCGRWHSPICSGNIVAVTCRSVVRRGQCLFYIGYSWPRLSANVGLVAVPAITAPYWKAYLRAVSA